MSVDADIIVLELSAVEATDAEGVLPRFAAVATEIDVTTLHHWTPPETAYVVIHDPGLRIFDAVEDTPGIRINRAARLEFPTEASVQLEALRALLPSRLEQPISFPSPGETMPQASIPPPARPLVFCPHCEERIHPPPVCATSES